MYIKNVAWYGCNPLTTRFHAALWLRSRRREKKIEIAIDIKISKIQPPEVLFIRVTNQRNNSYPEPPSFSLSPLLFERVKEILQVPVYRCLALRCAAADGGKRGEGPRTAKQEEGVLPVPRERAS